MFAGGNKACIFSFGEELSSIHFVPDSVTVLYDLLPNVDQKTNQNGFVGL